MSDRFESSLDPYLAGIFVEKLCRVLKVAGYAEVLRIPEPRVTEFRRGSEVLTLQIGHPRGHKQSVSVETESTDVDLLVTEAVRDTIVEVSDQLLAALPWVDNAAVLVEIQAHLTSLVKPT